jgi:hypothetical protein
MIPSPSVWHLIRVLSLVDHQPREFGMGCTESHVLSDGGSTHDPLSRSDAPFCPRRHGLNLFN